MRWPELIFITVMTVSVFLIVYNGLYLIKCRREEKAEAKAKEEARQKAVALYEANQAAKKTFTITDHIFSPKRAPSKVLKDLLYGEVDLIQEPDNEYDENAIRVEYYFQDDEEDYEVGYLFKGRLQDKVNEYINEGKSFTATVSDVDEDSEDAKRFIEIEVEFEN